MANSIDLIVKYSEKKFDEVYKREAISSIFDKPQDLVLFTGTKTVKIPKMQIGGLGDYYRANTPVDGNFGPYENGNAQGFGYQTSDMALKWEEFTLSFDRGARFQVEYFDNEESGGIAVGRATAEISSKAIIPEVDAICFAKIYENAGTKVSATTETPLATLNEAFLHFDNVEVPADDQVILVSPTYYNMLRNTTEVTKFLAQGDFNKNVSFKLTEYEGREFVVVPPQRFNTQVTTTQNGYRVSGTPIDFMVVSKSAVTHVTKYNKIKVIGGDMNLVGANFDGYSIFARVYHDVFVFDNKKIGIYAHTGATTYSGVATGQKQVNVTIKQGTSSGKTMFTSVEIFPADTYVMKYVYGANEPVLGTTYSGTDLTLNTNVSATEGTPIYVVALDTRGNVLAYATVTPTANDIKK